MKCSFKKILCGMVLALVMVASGRSRVSALSGLALSPLDKVVVLNPGETFSGDFYVINQAQYDEDLNYSIDVIPYYVDDNYNVVDNEKTDRNLMVDWISVENESGTVKPNNSELIKYIISVPQDAPAGGQYATIRVTNWSDSLDADGLDDERGETVIQSNTAMAYIIFAEITGETVKRGEIENVSVPSFLFNGDISGSSSIKNTGNVHGTATYTLQVYPLFSNEEVYTNEEEPKTRSILPDRTFYNETAWRETPAVGIFNVVYTVEFEGVTAQVSKMVIKCPIWLLFIIIFVIVAVIIWLVMRAKTRKSPKRKAAKSDDEE